MDGPTTRWPEPIPARIRVLIALHEVPAYAPIEAIADHAGVKMEELREWMRELALREPDPEA